MVEANHGNQRDEDIWLIKSVFYVYKSTQVIKVVSE
jgi:hypothetical protein